MDPKPDRAPTHERVLRCPDCRCLLRGVEIVVHPQARNRKQLYLQARSESSQCPECGTAIERVRSVAKAEKPDFWLSVADELEEYKRRACSATSGSAGS